MFIEIWRETTYLMQTDEHLVYYVLQLLITAILFFITMRVSKKELGALSFAFAFLIAVEAVCIVFCIMRIYNTTY